MPDVEVFISLLAAIVLFAQLARPLRVPYPILLVLGGLALGFVPGLPKPQLDPHVFFYFFLPPLVYAAAVLLPTEELKAHAQEIFLLAVGLVAATTVAVAVVAHAVAGLPWTAAFVLGAVVGATDPVAATSVIQRLGVSKRISTILEGEALVNDGTSLVAYKLAVGAATAAGALSLGHVALEFVWISLGGVIVGGLAGWLATWGRRWLTVAEVEVAFSLLIPFLAYFPAERIGVSGVLAAVTAGLVVGRKQHEMRPGTRLQRDAFWEVLSFLLNSVLFLLVGLSFPHILSGLRQISTVDLLGQALALAATVIALRFAWMFLVAPVVKVLDPRPDRRPQGGELAVLGWSAMRGGLSLAAALALPLTAAGRPFPARDQIIALTYLILLATLVVPGLTLDPLVRRLDVGPGEAQARRDNQARAHILHAALEHIEELARNDELPQEISERLHELYQTRLDRLQARPEAPSPDGDRGDRSEAALRARGGAVGAQRAALAELKDSRQIGTRAAHELEQELDLEERRLRPPTSTATR